MTWRHNALINRVDRRLVVTISGLPFLPFIWGVVHFGEMFENLGRREARGLPFGGVLIIIIFRGGDWEWCV